MSRQTVADSIRRRQYRAVVLAHGSSVCQALTRQLELLNCSVECAQSLTAARSTVEREAPQLLLIECARFPTQMRQIAELFRDAFAAHPWRPMLVGIGREACSTGVPQACGLDEFLLLPPDPNDVEALLERPVVGAAAETLADLPDCHEGAPITEALAQFPEEVQTAMLQAFVEDTAARFARIEESLREYDLRRVARDVHAVKSGCLQMGFRSMVDCCEDMRRTIEVSDVCGAHLYYRALTEAFNAIAGQLPRN